MRRSSPVSRNEVFMTVTRSVAALVVVVAAGCAQDKEGKARRLESVTWNSVKHELTWVVASGDKKETGKFETKDQQTYRIDMDGATMNYNGEARGFAGYSGTTDYMSFILVGTALSNFINSVFWGMGYALKNDMDAGVLESNWLAPLPRPLGPGRTPRFDVADGQPIQQRPGRELYQDAETRGGVPA